MKFLIAVSLRASAFIPASSFINFGDFCRPPRLLHPSLLLYWPKFANLLGYSALLFYLKLESARITMYRGSYHGSVLAKEMKNKIPNLSPAMILI